MKGYNFERLIGKKLEDASFTFGSNPLNNMHDWLRNQGEGVDFTVKSSGFKVGLEAKFSHAKIYRSWIERDWKPRFDRETYDFKVFVVNQGMKINDKNRTWLTSQGYLLLNQNELIGWLNFLRDYVKRNLQKIKRELQISKENRCNKLIEALKKNVNYGYFASQILAEDEKNEVNKEMFECKKCGFTTNEEGEASLHAFEDHNMEIEDCFTEDLNITLEEKPLEDGAVTEEENVPDETSALSPTEFVRQTQHDTGGSVPKHSKRPLQYEETLNTKNYFKEYYLRNYEALMDERSTVCGWCQRDWNILADELDKKLRENLDSRDQHAELEGKPKLSRIYHVKQKHPAIYDFLVKVGIIQQFIDTKATAEYDDHLKPTNPKNAESLSTEQLAELISSDPDKRAAFFKHWLNKLKER